MEKLGARHFYVVKKPFLYLFVLGYSKEGECVVLVQSKP